MATSAKQDIRIPELDSANGQAVLNLETYKSEFKGGLISFARVHFVRNGMMTFELVGDYSKRLHYDRTARGTQKAIDSQHSQVFTPSVIATLLDEIRAFYAAKAAR